MKKNFDNISVGDKVLVSGLNPDFVDRVTKKGRYRNKLIENVYGPTIAMSVVDETGWTHFIYDTFWPEARVGKI